MYVVLLVHHSRRKGTQNLHTRAPVGVGSPAFGGTVGCLRGHGEGQPGWDGTPWTRD